MYSVDASNNELDMWLVKVPKYIAKAWKEAPERSDLGKLQKTSDGSFKFIANPKSTTKSDQPSQIGEHKLTLQPITHQRMAIISQVKGDASNDTKAQQTSATADKTCFEGDINFRGELRTTGDTAYMSLKALSIKKAAQPERVARQTELVASYKPRGAAQLTHEANLRKKKEEAKRYIREDREVVQERIFKAFEKQQYYNIKDLERITSQPVTYLKEILKDICKYCSSGSHKNMWELKPEYRHYKS